MTLKRPILKGLVLSIAFVAFLPVIPGGSAQASIVPPDLRASLLLRTLAYDRNLAARAGESQITILVVEGSDRADTEAVATALESATARVSVAGLPVRIVRHLGGTLDCR